MCLPGKRTNQSVKLKQSNNVYISWLDCVSYKARTTHTHTRPYSQRSFRHFQRTYQWNCKGIKIKLRFYLRYGLFRKRSIFWLAIWFSVVLKWSWNFYQSRSWSMISAWISKTSKTWNNSRSSIDLQILYLLFFIYQKLKMDWIKNVDLQWMSYNLLRYIRCKIPLPRIFTMQSVLCIEIASVVVCLYFP